MADIINARRNILLNTPHKATASGDIATFTTDLKAPLKITGQIVPIQDLHGYDNPWPAGGGKNLLNLYLARTSHNDINYSLTADGKIHAQGTNSTGATSYSGGNYSTYSDCPWHFPAGTYTISCTVPSSNTDIGSVSFMIRRQSDNSQTNYNQLKNGASTFTIDEPFGAWFWFSVLNGKTVNIDVGLQLEVGSPATAWTPYENICPISGWTGANVWDDPAYGGTILWNQMFDGTATATWDGITTEYDATNKAIKITNDSRTTNYSSGSTRQSLITSDELVSGHKYLYKIYPETTGIVIVRNGNNVLAPIFEYDFSANVTLRITSAYDFVTTHPVGNVTEVQFNFFDLTEMFGAGNEPTTVAEFEALFPKNYYGPQTTPTKTLVSAVNGDPYGLLPLTWQTEAGIIYGGHYTINKDGSVNVVGEYFSVTMTGASGTSAIRHGRTFENKGAASTFDAYYTQFYCMYGVAHVILSDAIMPYIKCSHAKPTKFSDISVQDYIQFSWNVPSSGSDRIQTRLYFPLSMGINTTAKANQFLADQYAAGTPVVYTVPLGTPVTYHLANIGQFLALKGINNVWADTGEVSVEYWKH